MRRVVALGLLALIAALLAGVIAVDLATVDLVFMRMTYRGLEPELAFGPAHRYVRVGEEIVVSASAE